MVPQRAIDKRKIREKFERNTHKQRVETLRNPVQIAEKPDHKLHNGKRYANKDIVKKKRITNFAKPNEPQIMPNKRNGELRDKLVRQRMFAPNRQVQFVVTQAPTPQIQTLPMDQILNVQDNIDPPKIVNGKIVLPLPAYANVAGIPDSAIPEGFVKTQKWNGEWIIVPEYRLKKRRAIASQ